MAVAAAHLAGKARTIVAAETMQAEKRLPLAVAPVAVPLVAMPNLLGANAALPGARLFWIIRRSISLTAV